MLVENIISERYVNAVGNDLRAQATKKKYLDQVWNILQKSYAPIGGIKGKGFENKEAMLDLPMWKMGIRDGRVRAVIIYKDKNGRKSVAMGTDGSEDGAWFVGDIFKNELERSYGEKSKSALGKMLKTIPWEILQHYVVRPETVAEMNPDDTVIPLSDLPKDEWPDDAKVTLSRYPHLEPYGYLREITPGNMLFKIMIGTPGKTIR